MPITYEIDREKGLMVTRASGTISASDFFEYVDTILADPANEQCDELLILEEIDVEQISAGDIRGAARRSANLSRDDDFRVAVVAPGDADFGLSRMFQAFRELGDERMAVFRSIQDACDWLGVKVP